MFSLHHSIGWNFKSSSPEFMTRAHSSKSLQAENQTVIQRPQGWGNSQKINPNFNLGFAASWFSGLSVIFKNKIKLRRQQTACSKEKQDDAFQDSFKKLLLPEKNCSVILRALETFGPHQSFVEVSEFLTNEREGKMQPSNTTESPTVEVAFQDGKATGF